MRTRSNSPKYLAIARWLDQYKTHHSTENDISIILPNLYLTSRKGVSLDNIKRCSIQAIISVGVKLKQNEISFLRDYLFLNIPDTSEKTYMMENILPEAQTFIDTNITKGPVLVHCQMGISRSPTIVINYLVSIGWKPEESIKHVKSCRDCIRPDEAYLQLLVGDQ